MNLEKHSVSCIVILLSLAFVNSFLEVFAETLNTAIKGSAFLKREEINCVNGRKSCILSLSAEKKMQLENSAGTHVIGVERGKQRAKKHANGVKRGKLLARLDKRIKRGYTRSPLNVTSDHFANGLVFFFLFCTLQRRYPQLTFLS